MGFVPSSTPEYGIRFLVKLVNSGSGPRISSFFGLRGQSAISKSDQSTALKLREKQFIEEGEGKLFSGSASYRLTERGIFYLLSELEEYPPVLLIKYSEITRYLKQCCVTTISRLDSLRNSPTEENLDENIKELELDLMWLAKILVLKLAMMYSEAGILRSTAGMTKDNAKVALYELENDMKRVLFKDNKFRNFLDSAYGEIAEGYQELRKLSEQV